MTNLSSTWQNSPEILNTSANNKPYCIRSAQPCVNLLQLQSARLSQTDPSSMFLASDRDINK